MKPLSRAALIHVKTEQLARIQRITVVTHVAVLHVSPDLTAKLLSRAAPVHVKTEVLARIPPISALTHVHVLQVSSERTAKPKMYVLAVMDRLILVPRVR